MKYKNLIFSVFLLMAVACKMIKTDDKITRVVTPSFPGLILKGDAITGTTVGTGAFNDPGAIGYDSVTKVSTNLVPLVNDVDLTKPGFYTVQYEAKNSYGYRTNMNRLVLVTSVSPTDDISGTYKRTSNGQTVTLTKKGTGLYTIDNIGGVSGNPAYLFDIYVGITSQSTIEVPTQSDPNGADIFVTEGTLVKSGNDVTFSYRVQDKSLFGTQVRTFVKQ